MAEASVRLPMRVVAYGLMPNHFHLVIRPHADGDLGRWMHWLSTAHVRRYLRYSGHVWQSRSKAFPIQDDAHLGTVVRSVERNAPRAPPRPFQSRSPGVASTGKGGAGPGRVQPEPVPCFLATGLLNGPGSPCGGFLQRPGIG